MRLIHVETLKLGEFFSDKIPPYAVLSHTWGAAGEEVSFSDIEAGTIEKAGKIKLEGCCEQAKKDKLGYVWIDTCCIDKTNAVELSEAINSMFRWYRQASICYVYLPDVPSADNSLDPESDHGSKFFSSRWFRRGWTLQELLAPSELRFYNQAWKSIGSRVDISKEIETITGIPDRFLLGWEDLHKASVAQRMSWAARRETTREEDIAYCLLGIFDVTMSMIYGEGGERAFIRLQQEIMKNTGDHSILAWGIDAAESTPSISTDILSAGILATAPSNFANCGRIDINKMDATLFKTFDVSGGRLRVHLPLHTTSAGEIYGLLNCGPNAEQVVGIPLRKTVSGAPADEYLRPQGHYPILLSKTTSVDLTKAIYIRMECQNKAHEVTNRRYWLRIDGYQKINLTLDDVHPPVSWEKGRALIAKATDSDGIITRRYLTRFRTQDEGSRDVVVVLEFNIAGLQSQARCHVMTLSRDTTLEDLSQKLMYMRLEAFRKQTANDGDLNVKVAVEERLVAQEPMLVVRIAQASSMSKTTVDANWELQQVDQKLEFVKLLQQEDQVRLEAEQLGQQRNEKKATLDAMRERLVVVNENLEKLKEEQRLLEEEQRLLEDGLEKGVRHVEQLIERHKEVREQQDGLLGRESEIQQHLDEHETKEGPGNWLETIIKMQLDAGKIGRGLKDVGDFDSSRPQLSRAAESGQNIDGQTLLSWAASNGYKATARLLLEKGAYIESKNDGWTPLGAAAGDGHEAVARLLIEKGANTEAKSNDGWTPLRAAAGDGHEAVARLLIEKGANIDAKSNSGWAPLGAAAGNGHEAIARLLIEKGANIDAKSNAGWPPLGAAADRGHEAMVRLLIEKGANIEAKSNDGWTPLGAAAAHGHEATVQLLLQKGANIKVKNNHGNTPLMVATYQDHKAVVLLLLEKDADIKAKNNVDGKGLGRLRDAIRRL